MLKHARLVPIALGPDKLHRIVAKPERVGGGWQVNRHFRVALAAEREGALPAHGPRTEAGPEWLQTLPCMAIGRGEALAAGDAQGLPHDPECYAGAPVLGPDREAFQLGEAAEEAQPQARRGLAIDPPEQVHAAKIVAVELFLVGAVLSGHVDNGADGHGALEVIQRAHDGDRFGLRYGSHRSESG